MQVTGYIQRKRGPEVHNRAPAPTTMEPYTSKNTRRRKFFRFFFEEVQERVSIRPHEIVTWCYYEYDRMKNPTHSVKFLFTSKRERLRRQSTVFIGDERSTAEMEPTCHLKLIVYCYTHQKFCIENHLQTNPLFQT